MLRFSRQRFRFPTAAIFFSLKPAGSVHAAITANLRQVLLDFRSGTHDDAGRGRHAPAEGLPGRQERPMGSMKPAFAGGNRPIE